MEDEDMTILDITPECSIFGVFDGHGGFIFYKTKNDVYFRQRCCVILLKILP
jgi:hypothetical protein